MDDGLTAAWEEHRAATEGWRELVVGLTGQQANWRPEPSSWSVAQCLEHVRIVTEEVLPGLEVAIAEAREEGRTATGPFRYGLIGRRFLAGQDPLRRRRVRTLRLYQPSSSKIELAAAVGRFAAVQATFAEVMTAADGTDLVQVMVPSPAQPLLRLSVGIWLQALPRHTLRHLRQAQEVADRQERIG